MELDLSLYYLMEAQGFADAYLEIPLADSFFEASESIKKVNENNEKARKGANNSLAKAIEVLINSIKKCINNFTKFLSESYMDKKEKAQYDEFKAYVKKHPEFAKKNITFEDFKAYEKAYDEALKGIQKEIDSENPSKEKIDQIMENLNKSTDSIASSAKGMGNRAVASMTIDTALKIADSNALTAKAINYALNNELISLEGIEKALGKDDTEKFKKKIDSYARNGFAHRAKVAILRKKSQTLTSIMEKQKKTLLSFTNLDKDLNVKDGKKIIDSRSVAKGAFLHPKLTSDTVGGAEGAKDLAAKAISTGMKGYKSKRKVKDLERDLNDAIKFYTNR